MYYVVYTTYESPNDTKHWVECSSLREAKEALEYLSLQDEVDFICITKESFE